MQDRVSPQKHGDSKGLMCPPWPTAAILPSSQTIVARTQTPSHRMKYWTKTQMDPKADVPYNPTPASLAAVTTALGGPPDKEVRCESSWVLGIPPHRGTVGARRGGVNSSVTGTEIGGHEGGKLPS